MRYFFFLSFLLILLNSVSAQSKRDSLLSIWNNTALPDTQRMAAAQDLVWRVYLYRAPDSARHIAEAQLELALQSGLLNRISSAYHNIGVTYHIQGELNDAIPFYNRSLEIDKERVRKNPDDENAIIGIASSYTNISVLYQQIGNLALAMEGYHRALHILDSLENSGSSVNINIANLQNNLGLAHQAQESNNDALLWYHSALKRYQQEEPGTAIANVHTNIGNTLQRLARTFKQSAERDSLTTMARQHHEQSMEVRIAIGDKRGEANSLNNLAAYFQEQASQANNPEEKKSFLQKSEDLYRQSIALADEAQDRPAKASTMGNLAENLIIQQRWTEAASLAEQALELAQTIGEIEAIVKASDKLYVAYKKLERPAEALAMFELYRIMDDSVRNLENSRLMIRQQYEYDYSRREAELVFEQEKKNVIAAEALRRKNIQRNAFIGGFGIVFLFAGVFFVQRNRISKEKDRSEHLLLNILPAETAQELKAKGSADAKLIDHVSVLFTDFKGFTAMSEQLSPKELVKDLHECFSAFDRICEKYGIEKIKTIGDAYMAAGGLPTPNNTHAADIVNAALEMAEVVEKGKAKKISDGLPFFEVRIGINTGPVVAGIVGIKKFQYDIWGDTVNTASRMESSGAIGKVNISQSTHDLLKDNPDYAFEYRGKIQAKGKGEIEMYFVESVSG